MHLAPTIFVDGEFAMTSRYMGRTSGGYMPPPPFDRDLLKSSQGALHAASAFPSGGFASSDGGAFTTPVV
jgi:hypothetical protein